MTRLTAEEVGTAIFGASDGLSGVLGVLAGLILTHAPKLIVFAAAGACVVGNTVSMAGSEYLGDPRMLGRYRRAAIMGLATLVGGLGPVVPFALHLGAQAVPASLAIVVLEGLAIAHGRPDRHGPRGYVETFVILIGAGCAAAAFSVAVGVGAVTG